MAKPLVFLTGFFGSGKTTLLRSLVTGLKERGLTADVILNDFANAELDAATLGDEAASIVPIAASCACCESMDELVSLCTAASQSSGDILLIELNGTADPLSLLEAFTLVESRLPFFPRLQAGLVDARHWGTRGEWTPLERRQIETAGYWILSHEDEVDQSRQDEAASDVSATCPYAVRTTAKEFLDILERTIRSKTAKNSQSKSNTHPHGGECCSHAKHDPVHRLSHQFTGCQFPLPGRVRREAIETLLTGLPDWVVRAKALVKTVEQPGTRLLFQRSGTDPIQDPLPVPDINRVSPSLVCVGACLDPEELREIVRKHFGSEAANLLT